jgi:hypothetical protein
MGAGWVEPAKTMMASTSPWIVGASVAVDDLDLGPRAEIVACLGGQVVVALDRDHPTVRPDDLGEHSGVVAGPGADLHDPLLAPPVDVVETARPQAGQAIVQPSRLIDRHKNVVIKPTRIIIGRHEAVIGMPIR